MNNEVKLKKGELKDLDEILILFEETIVSTCKNHYNPQQIRIWQLSARDKDRWNSALQNQFFIVAQINERIVGFGSLKNGNYIDFLYVHMDYLRQGIAAKIFDKLENEAKKVDSKKLFANVSKTALPFFEFKGFQIIKENINRINGVEINNYKMIR